MAVEITNLEDVITDAVDDSQVPEEPSTPVEGDTPTEPVEVAPEPTEPAVEVVETKPEVEAPAELDKPDDFEKKFGIPANSPSGRENRIPYSRVKKITEKATKEAVEAKVKEFEPKLAEFQTKVKDYEERLVRVAKFEETMVNKPEQFLQLLASIPAYAQFFQAVDAAFAAQAAQPQGGAPPVQVTEDMPAPNQEMPDGSKAYDMDGIAALLEWKAKQVESRLTKTIESRYKPIEDEWQAHQRIQSIVPHVQSQIAEARTWKLFNEHEDEIVAVLKSDPKISLERAYQKVVFPKLEADRNKIREELLKEIKQAPKATSVVAGGSKAATQVSTGPRALEDIIAEQVKTIKG